MQRINCAVYVRKSSEKGLDLEFNSLHNQEEACKNYILSQAFNGWEYYKTYIDGGISGGTMKRPALLEMLADMKKGLIQVVLVYKVDRLSRSILDFHNMMKEFEKYGANFVSITQAFEFKCVNFNELTPKKQNKLVQSMIDKIIYYDNNLIYFIRISDLSYLKPFKKENYLNINNTAEFHGKIHLSDDGLNLIVEKEIRINNNHLTNKYVGSGKKIISVTENNNNLIKALSVGRRYGKMSMEGMSIKGIQAAEQKGCRTIYRYLSLNYLSPRIVNDIMESNAPPHINLQSLFEIASKYPDFEEQEKAFYGHSLK